MLLLTLKSFVQSSHCWKTVLNIVWIRNRSRNWNQNFSKVGTTTATNHYGSTALSMWADVDRYRNQVTQIGPQPEQHRNKSNFQDAKILHCVSFSLETGSGKSTRNGGLSWPPSLRRRRGARPSSRSRVSGRRRRWVRRDGVGCVRVPSEMWRRRKSRHRRRDLFFSLFFRFVSNC